jgi:hypothetical protein
MPSTALGVFNANCAMPRRSGAKPSAGSYSFELDTDDEEIFGPRHPPTPEFADNINALTSLNPTDYYIQPNVEDSEENS